MRLFLLLIMYSLLTGCGTVPIYGNISSSVDPSFVPKSNMRVVVVPQEFDSIYYLPALKEALQVKGFRNVTVSNSRDVPLNSFDLKVSLGVDRQSTEETKMVDEYGVVSTKHTPGDVRCKETNNGLTGKRMRCRSDEGKTENVYGVVGKKEKTTTTLNRSIALTFSRLPNDQTVLTTIGSSEERDWKCSNSGIFKFLIIHTVKYLNFGKPINTNYGIDVPEGYSCDTFDQYERSIRNRESGNQSSSNDKLYESQSKNNGYVQKTGCVTGDCFGGKGTMIYPDGAKYVGQWKDDKRNGEGTYIFPSGEKYVGQWKDGNRSGEGTNIYPTGHKYVGQWKGGNRSGEGTMIYPDGAKYVGQWKGSNPNGEGTYTFPSGEKYAGQWRDNQFLKEIDPPQNKYKEVTTYEIPELGLSVRDYRGSVPVTLSLNFTGSQSVVSKGGVIVVDVLQGGKGDSLGIEKGYRIVSYSTAGFSSSSVPFNDAKTLRDLAKDKGSKFFANFIVIKKDGGIPDWSKLCLLWC